MTIWINGKFTDRAGATVSVFDHGLLYGDGVFEGIRVYKGDIFRLEEHIKRLYESAGAIQLNLSISQKEMCDIVQEAVTRDGAGESYIRLIATRGEGTLGLDPSTCPRATVIVIVDKIQLYPEELYETGINIITSSTRRVPVECLDPRIKSLNYLGNILARAEATRLGCHEALMLTTSGKVAECSADNVFIVINGELKTPHPSTGALDGITMRAVMELAASHGIPAGFAELTLHDIYTADECFLTGTGAGIVPVVKVDSRSIGSGAPGEITLRLTSSYHELVHAS